MNCKCYYLVVSTLPLERASQFLPAKQRYLPGMFYLPVGLLSHCTHNAPGYELPGDSWDLKIGTQERMRVRLLWRPEVEAAEEPQRDALYLHINH